MVWNKENLFGEKRPLRYWKILPYMKGFMIHSRQPLCVKHQFRGALSIMVIIVGGGTGDLVQMHDKAFCISLLS